MLPGKRTARRLLRIASLFTRWTSPARSRASSRRLFVALVLITGLLVSQASAPSNLASVELVLATGACGLPDAAFCDTFDKAYPGGQAGDLDDTRWSVTRLSNSFHFGDDTWAVLNTFYDTHHHHCFGEMRLVVPDEDVTVCNGHYMESLHDEGGTTNLFSSARIRQPFDWANRTGRLVFDVDAKAVPEEPTGDGYWVQLFISDEPIPSPYQLSSAGNLKTMPRRGVVISFQRSCGTMMTRGNVSDIYIIDKYAVRQRLREDDDLQRGPCYVTQDNVRNHFEVRISQQHLEVWGSDAGGANFQRRAFVGNADLPLTRGYVYLQHVQYQTRTVAPNLPLDTTYHWDMVGFDGPVLPVAREYEVPEALTAMSRTGVNLGYAIRNGGMQTCCPFQRVGSLAFRGNMDLSGATGAQVSVTISFPYDTTLRYRLNQGTWRSYTYQALNTDDVRVAVLPVPLSDLRPGTNTIEFVAERDGVFSHPTLHIDVTRSDATPASP